MSQKNVEKQLRKTPGVNIWLPHKPTRVNICIHTCIHVCTHTLSCREKQLKEENTYNDLQGLTYHDGVIQQQIISTMARAGGSCSYCAPVGKHTEVHAGL